ncbi:MAG TPA: tRNA (guanosine(37)-N1)-methyltransferase TrmD [Planctomycetota bacterium]|nr:tRNA (guanosine(37)-N1)-methyltransferase TrmD [Planctomycetota bacterium]
MSDASTPGRAPLLIDLVTLFPDACDDWLDTSIVGRARRRGLIEAQAVDPRAWAGGRHRAVDDRPFGGGPGMVLAAPPIAGCIDWLMTRSAKPRLLMTSPQGRRLDQPWVEELARETHLIVLCGHYEGIDERINELYRPEPFSIGDLVISGGELAALVLVDAVTRLQPGALGNARSAAEDSFAGGGGFDHPCYTRPREFRGVAVPDALLSGDHAAIARWRAQERERRGRGAT